MNHTVLALSGGVGGAKLAFGLSRILSPERLAILANTGDDQSHMGLMVCPDIDTLIYTLAGINNTSQGWGIQDETWQCMQALEKLEGETWFQLGDKDIATHLKRNTELARGRSLTEVTALISQAYGVQHPILPMCDEPVSTWVEVQQDNNQGIERLPFHDYFVKYQCKPKVKSIHFNNKDLASITPAIQSRIAISDLLIVCPSNPFLSIDPIFSVPGLKQSLIQSIQQRVVVSPIIGGQAVKGPSAKIMKELQLPVTALGIAEMYQSFATHFVLDEQDSQYTEAISAMGLEVLICQTLMQTEQDKINLATAILNSVKGKTE